MVLASAHGPEPLYGLLLECTDHVLVLEPVLVASLGSVISYDMHV